MRPLAQASHLDRVLNYYSTHPINERQILEKLAAGGVDLDSLTEDALQAHDQDHYGGPDANDVLARSARIDASCHVLDVCSGMGGPARYLAHNYGCRVTGIDLTRSRVAGAETLTGMVGLADRVAFREANALENPFPEATFDVAIAQEAFCHIPDKPRLIAECVRVLKPGGRIAFTDIVVRDGLTAEMRDRLRDEMTFMDLQSSDGYRGLLEGAGCSVIEAADLSADWTTILAARLAMYRSLKEQTVAQFGLDHFERWDAAYRFFVGLYRTGELGGGRFVARKDRA